MGAEELEDSLSLYRKVRCIGYSRARRRKFIMSSREKYWALKIVLAHFHFHFHFTAMGRVLGGQEPNDILSLFAK